MKNDDTGKGQGPQSIPIHFVQPDLIAVAMAGMLNDWKTDSVRFGALGEHPRRPRKGRRGTSPQCGEG
jgi:hypothetical protein